MEPCSQWRCTHEGKVGTSEFSFTPLLTGHEMESFAYYTLPTTMYQAVWHTNSQSNQSRQDLTGIKGK